MLRLLFFDFTSKEGFLNITSIGSKIFDLILFFYQALVQY